MLFFTKPPFTALKMARSLPPNQTEYANMFEDLLLKRVSPYNDEVSNLIQMLDQYQAELYPAQSNHLDGPEILAEANCNLVGAYKENKLLGIGASKQSDNYGELKRFFVQESFRGQGIAECIIAVLETFLVEKEIFISRLETGIHQHAAIRFYKKIGYGLTQPFGNYQLDPLSVFMQKHLTSTTETNKGNLSSYYVVTVLSPLKGLSTDCAEILSKLISVDAKHDGFLGRNSFQSSESEVFAVSYWLDRQCISNWLSICFEQKHHIGNETFSGKIKIFTAFVEA